MENHTLTTTPEQTASKVRTELPVQTVTSDSTCFECEFTRVAIGKLITMARRERKLKQKELGRLISVLPSWVNQIENATSREGNFNMKTLEKVFDALNAKVTLRVELK